MRRLFNLFAAGLVLTLGGFVYRAKYEAREEQARVAVLQEQLRQERSALTELRAEIAHLEDPARLRQLAFLHLGLAPIDTLRVVTLEETALLLDMGQHWLDVASQDWTPVAATPGDAGARAAAAGSGAEGSGAEGPAPTERLE